MKDFLNSPIIDVIKEYPKVGVLLGENGIGCVTCSVGTCLLKDVLKIHYIPEDQTHILMGKILGIISGTAELESVNEPSNTEESEGVEKSGNRIEPKTLGKSTTVIVKEKSSQYNISIKNLENPITELVEEHIYIKKVLSVIPEISEEFLRVNQVDFLLLSELVSFIRNYADKYHHAKEESILFGYAPEGFAPVKAMLEEHVIGRNFIRTAELSAAEGNIVAVSENLLGYRELLFGHIDREDKVLYPWFEKNLNNEQINEMAKHFNEANNNFGEGYSLDYEQWADALHNRYKGKI